ncbi:DinB family protein [Mucisphaera calidilacus]|uniref:DinB superfamily protein n=1 Tax=Mucisphaera calidilacus TaxID=2527982 RepID=A0A518C170_9BACT|nr:DinB family protein [Mucisphaera calidilacus]QDU72973.1 DinB superfamily protein [Mucisphaera calidilacus]
MTDATSTGLVKTALGEQIAAAIAMLRDTIDACPHNLWTTTVGERAFWENAFHITFYIDLYLTLPGQPFPETPDWAWPNAAGLGRHMEPPFEPLKPEELGPTLEQPKVLAYLDAMPAKLKTSIAAETADSLAGESGFFWLPFSRLSAYLYNLRHIQHHTGQLSATLRRNNISLDWRATG